MFEQTSSMQVINLCKSALDAAWVRQRVIADNIANVNTPGFKRSKVLFEDKLKEALNEKGKIEAITTEERHIKFSGYNNPTFVSPQIIVENDTIYRNDKNNVDINEETAALAKNNILYEALITRISQKLKAIKSLVSEGKTGR